MGSGGIFNILNIFRKTHIHLWNETWSYIESAWIYRKNEDPLKAKVWSRIPCGRWSRRLHPGCTMRLHVGLKPCHSCQAMRFRKVKWTIVNLLVTWYIMILCISDHLWRICQRCIHPKVGPNGCGPQVGPGAVRCWRLWTCFFCWGAS